MGQHVALDLAPVSGAPHRAVRELAVLSWNVWVGRGRLREVVGRVRDGAYASLRVDGSEPLLVLVQEAFRSDDSVPSRSNGGAPRDRPRDFRPEEDVVEVARELGLNVRDVPSMRNGLHRSDRGNAVLSSLPLAPASAF